jgi:hypothetical protein
VNASRVGSGPSHAGPCRPSPSASFQSFVLQEQPQLQGGLDHEIPGNAAAGIEIEDELIGMLDIIHRRRPGMDLDHVHLDEPEQVVWRKKYWNASSVPSQSNSEVSIPG